MAVLILALTHSAFFIISIRFLHSLDLVLSQVLPIMTVLSSGSLRMAWAACILLHFDTIVCIIGSKLAYGFNLTASILLLLCSLAPLLSFWKAFLLYLPRHRIEMMFEEEVKSRRDLQSGSATAESARVTARELKSMGWIVAAWARFRAVKEKFAFGGPYFIGKSLVAEILEALLQMNGLHSACLSASAELSGDGLVLASTCIILNLVVTPMAFLLPKGESRKQKAIIVTDVALDILYILLNLSIYKVYLVKDVQSITEFILLYLPLLYPALSVSSEAVSVIDDAVARSVERWEQKSQSHRTIDRQGPPRATNTCGFISNAKKYVTFGWLKRRAHVCYFILSVSSAALLGIYISSSISVAYGECEKFIGPSLPSCLRPRRYCARGLFQQFAIDLDSVKHIECKGGLIDAGDESATSANRASLRNLSRLFPHLESLDLSANPPFGFPLG